MRSFVKTSLVAVALAAGFAAPVAFTTPVAAQAAPQQTQLQQQAAALVAAGDIAGFQALVAANQADVGDLVSAAVAVEVGNNNEAGIVAVVNAALAAAPGQAIAITNAAVTAAPNYAPQIVPVIVNASPSQGSEIVQAAVDAANTSNSTPAITTGTTTTTDTTTTTTDTPVVVTPVVPTIVVTPTIPVVPVPSQGQVAVNAQLGNPTLPQIGGGNPSSPT